MRFRGFAAVVIASVVGGLAGCADRGTQPVPPPANVPAPRVGPPPSVGVVSSIDLVDFISLQQSDRVLAIDVRPALFHSFGAIPGSINWPKAAFDSNRQAREREVRDARNAGKTVVLYCTDAACPDARDVAERLALRGHDVCVLHGGWEAWKAAGLPGG